MVQPMPRATSLPDEGRRRVVIDQVLPNVDRGRFAIKRVVGDRLLVQADAFPDGHDHITVRLRHRPPGATEWSELAMGDPDNDRWSAELPLTRIGRHEYTVVAWIDHFGTWRHDLARRAEADVATVVDMAIGASIVREAAARAVGQDAVRLDSWADAIDGEPTDKRLETAMDDGLLALIEAYPDRRFETVWDPVLAVTVDPPHARFGAWYELFPRSASSDPGRHGTFHDVIERLPYVAGMGFDVLYLPPIHPIGRDFRKGPNNSLEARPDDPGVPWAIGAAEGGHTAVHPELGTLSDFDELVSAAAQHDILIALDLAFQASRDHPYLEAHRDWFRSRPDGTIQYAENPPKKYQDVYPFDFETDAWPALWEELREVTRFWMDHGVRIFRVDNPHTKPFDFWEWLIDDIKATDPDVIFLAEAFTRPKVMYRLAKLGFSQSYTYFTWRNEKRELASYLEEIDATPGQRLLPSQLLHQHPGHPPRVPAGRRTACLRGAAGAGGDADTDLRHLRPSVRAAPGPAARARQRGVPRLGEVPAAPLGPRNQPVDRAARHPRQSHPSRARCAADTRATVVPAYHR